MINDKSNIIFSDLKNLLHFIKCQIQLIKYLRFMIISK
jgi:hypothetical protein